MQKANEPKQRLSRSDFSVVSGLNIRTDNIVGLRAGLEIALLYHRSISHYKEVIEDDGTSKLHLYWTGRDGSVKLPFALKDAQVASDFVSNWIDQASYPKNVPSTDGSVSYGFKLYVTDFYETVTIETAWIVYSK